MNEEVNYKQFFLDWCSHFIVRSVRLRQYLSERAASIPSGSYRAADIIDDLLRWNDKLAEELRDLGKLLLEISPEQAQEARSTYHTSLRILFRGSFPKLHGFLNYIPSVWPRPELTLFLREVLRAAGYTGVEPMPWTIVVTGEFNYSDILIPQPGLDFRTLLGRSGQGLGAHASSSPARDVLEIPAAEKENPLMWPNLMHELGHSLGESRRIIHKAYQLPRVEQKPPEIRNLLRQHWVPELVADLIATDLLGLAYHGNFVRFAAYWTEKSVRMPAFTHPPVEARRRYISWRLQDVWKLDKGLIDFLEEQYDVRSTLDHEDPVLRGQTYDELQRRQSFFSNVDWNAELLELAREVCQLDEYRSTFRSPGGLGDTRNYEALADRLASGELIASRRMHSAASSGAATGLSAREGAGKGAQQARSLLSETPNDVRDIVAAATLVNSRHASQREGVPPLIQSFCKDTQMTMRDRLIHLWEDVHKADLAVTKSIEAAEMMRFYQESKAHPDKVGGVNA